MLRIFSEQQQFATSTSNKYDKGIKKYNESKWDV